VHFDPSIKKDRVSFMREPMMHVKSENLATHMGISALFLCLDKTGTLTTDEMTVERVIQLTEYGLEVPLAISSIVNASEEKNATLNSLEEYCKGYLSVGAEFLTDAEIDLLAESVIMMTFECGIRFLSDFLDGDVYFATAYPEHNLVRAGNQFKLVADMEEKLKKTKEIVALAAGK
jgi:magnesium-transporting ATPase (P-type)